MICECGGVLDVIRVEEYPENIKDKISYKRLCDVECLKCGKQILSQPYDWGKPMNVAKGNMKKVYSTDE
ncbi:hypothetical protein SAMN05192533_102306 [Mesobacillus persicus]|uniref:Uncharacterized protein n=1 Tax=Mesobacillus persicus TaxID=930146 RepID=A0A1H7XRC4_9BACI|nr:hypothetical protein [Mesobacillus persicus]SEM35728.1 hypothetical protein SAMN05192533_102306 [Mesobacillus persicus]